MLVYNMEVAMRKSLRFNFCILLILFFWGCHTTGEVVYYSAPADPPGTERQMKVSGFWIDKLDNPDKIIMSPEEIEKFNLQLSEKFRWNRDFSKPLEPLTAEQIKTDIQDDINWCMEQPVFFADGKKVTPAFFEEMKDAMALDNLPEIIEPRYGLVASYSDQRVFPSTVFSPT